MSLEQSIEKIIKRLNRVDIDEKINEDSENQLAYLQETLNTIYQLCKQLPKKERYHRDEQSKLQDLVFYGHISESENSSSEE